MGTRHKKQRNKKRIEIVNAQSLPPQDFALEVDPALNIILQPPLLERKFCSYEEEKSFKNFYGDHRELFSPNTKVNNPKREGSFVQEDTSSLSQQLFRRESGNNHKLCLLYALPGGEKCMSLLVIEIGEDGFLGENTYSVVSLPFWRPDVGFGSMDSKCYVIGGEEPLKNQNLPLDVFVCDLSRKVLAWEMGPRLNGGKPNPIIVTVNEKLYALAGTSDVWRMPYQNKENTFEVLDLDSLSWRVLPEPPFFSLYEKGYPHPKIKGHTVIGSVIYLQLVSTSNTLYSFNVDSETWSEFVENDDDNSFSTRSGSDEIILHNLRVGDWQQKADVVDYLMFRTSGHELENLTVYAYDLTSRIEDNEYGKATDGVVFFYSEDKYNSDESEESEQNEICKKYDRRDFMDEEYVLLLDGGLVTVPVLGLTHISRYNDNRTSFFSFVSHLDQDLFALVCTFSSSIIGERLCDTEYCFRVRACVFQASVVELSDLVDVVKDNEHYVETKYKERYIAAYNVKDVQWPLPSMGILSGWCKVQNDGRQTRFRRPQKQHGTSYYHDGVAGQEVSKNSPSDLYTERVSIPR